MQQQFEITAQLRDQSNSSANRRMRRVGQVPAVVYGGSRPPVLLSLNHNELIRHLENEAFYSHILTLKAEGKDEKVIYVIYNAIPAKHRFCI